MAFRERAGSWGPAQLDWVLYHFGWAPIAKASVPGVGFESFLVLSQLATGLGLRGIVEQWRLQKKSVELGATMGHLIWQLQDNWPGQSFGLLNWGGEWKQQLHFVRRSFAPLLVTAAGDVPIGAVHLVSDLPTQLNQCNVSASVWFVDSPASHPQKQWSVVVPTVPRGGVVEAPLHIPPSALNVLPANSWILRLTASCNNGVIAAHTDHFASNFSLMRPKLMDPKCSATSWGTDGDSCTFSIRCENPAIFVVPDAGTLHGTFSDSGFVVLPLQPKVMRFDSGMNPCNPAILQHNLTLSSLYTLLPDSL